MTHPATVAHAKFLRDACMGARGSQCASTPTINASVKTLTVVQVKKLTEEQIDSLMLSYKEMLQSAKGHEFGVSAASCTTISAPF